MNLKTLHSVVLLNLVITATAPAQFCDVNLLVNPGCDEDLISGEIPGWTEVRGTDWTRRTSNPSGMGSPACFFAGTADTAELVQDVDVSFYTERGFLFSFYAYMRTGVETPSDVARVIFEFRSQANDLIGVFDSGEVVSPDGWHSLFHCCDIYSGTATIRVRLIGVRRNGPENNAYFDSIEVYPICVDPVEPTTWSRIKGLGDSTR